VSTPSSPPRGGTPRRSSARTAASTSLRALLAIGSLSTLTPLSLLPLLPLVFGGPAWAAPPTSALVKFEEGTAAYKAGKYGDALVAFRASYQIEASPNTRFMIGSCYQALGQLGSAYSFFRRAAKEAEDRILATGDPRYAATRDAAQERLRELDPKVPRLVLKVSGEVPPGFYLAIDGVELPAASYGLPMELDVGEHTVLAVGPRVRRIEQVVLLGEGERREITLPVQRIETALIKLVFHSRPAGATVTLDGAPLAPELSDKPQYVNTGEHRVEVQAPGFRSLIWQERLRNNQEIALPIHFLQRPLTRRTPKWLFFTTATAALAALGVGIYFGIRARDAEEAELMKPDLLRIPSVRDEIKRDATIANALYGTAGGLGILSVVLGATAEWKTAVPALFRLERPGAEK
jgi:hypothetical protein